MSARFRGNVTAVVLGGQWQCGVEVLRTDRYRVAYPIVVPPRSLIVKPSSACLSAMSMSS